MEFQLDATFADKHAYLSTILVHDQNCMKKLNLDEILQNSGASACLLWVDLVILQDYRLEDQGASLLSPIDNVDGTADRWTPDLSAPSFGPQGCDPSPPSYPLVGGNVPLLNMDVDQGVLELDLDVDKEEFDRYLDPASLPDLLSYTGVVVDSSRSAKVARQGGRPVLESLETRSTFGLRGSTVHHHSAFGYRYDGLNSAMPPTLVYLLPVLLSLMLYSRELPPFTYLLPLAALPALYRLFNFLSYNCGIRRHSVVITVIFVVWFGTNCLLEWVVGKLFCGWASVPAADQIVPAAVE